MSDLPNKNFKVYVDPTFKKNDILMGFKGNSHLDTGYIMSEFASELLPPEPSVVDRLAGVVDEGIQERIDEVDKRRQRYLHYDIDPFDVVPE